MGKASTDFEIYFVGRPSFRNVRWTLFRREEEGKRRKKVSATTNLSMGGAGRANGASFPTIGLFAATGIITGLALGAGTPWNHSKGKQQCQWCQEAIIGGKQNAHNWYRRDKRRVLMAEGKVSLVRPSWSLRKRKRTSPRRVDAN